jgi:hypothetical protein|tara:strand:- start:4051 stop:4824 length:774 start_codon:yes stop_codon:yes gene_type:complete
MSTTSDYLNDNTNIVNAKVKDIRLCQEFIDEFNVNDLDWKLLEGALHMNSGMSEYQCQHFVADSQITPWRKTRQALLELETRYHAYVEIKHSLKKAKVQKKILLREYEEETDELQREILDIDISKNDYDITIWKRKYAQAQKEMQIFLDIVKQNIKNEDEIDYFTTFNENEERAYWVARLGKQAAMDIISYGRIGSGNMESISMMPEEDQVQTLKIAVRFSQMVGTGIDKVSKELQPELKQFQLGDKVVPPKLTGEK